MSASVLRVVRTVDGLDAGVAYWMWCPACDDSVRISDAWNWDGNLELPTFSPSIKIGGVQWRDGDAFYKPSHGRVAPGGEIVCHSFLRAGVWEFLGDCTHDQAGKSLPMVPIPDWLIA